MEYILLFIGIALLFRLVVTSIGKWAWNDSEKKNEDSDHSERVQNRGRATGCKTWRLACKYANHDKTRTLSSFKEDTIYCDRRCELVEKTDNCSMFVPLGCKSCMNANAKTSSGCYCSYYQKNVEIKATCPDFMDYFDTPQGKASAAAIKNRIMKKST